MGSGNRHRGVGGLWSSWKRIANVNASLFCFIDASQHHVTGMIGQGSHRVFPFYMAMNLWNLYFQKELNSNALTMCSYWLTQKMRRFSICTHYITSVLSILEKKPRSICPELLLIDFLELTNLPPKERKRQAMKKHRPQTEILSSIPRDSANIS